MLDDDISKFNQLLFQHRNNPKAIKLEQIAPLYVKIIDQLSVSFEIYRENHNESCVAIAGYQFQTSYASLIGSAPFAKYELEQLTGEVTDADHETYELIIKNLLSGNNKLRLSATKVDLSLLITAEQKWKFANLIVDTFQ